MGVMVALTGIERARSQFSSVQLSLSRCVYVQLVQNDAAEHPTIQARGSAVAAQG